MSTKKCACFTPSGLVYTRLETDGTIARRPVELQKDNNNTRSKRSLNNDVFEPDTVDSILEENPSIGHLSFKNEFVDESENRNIVNNIDKLIKETEAFLKAYERTKENIDHKRTKRKAQHWNRNKHKQKNDPMLNNNESSLECKIEKDGTVNCSQVIYNDLKAWHTNRLSLEDQIRQLRTKLEDLKEIKRHLKISKPAVEIQTITPTYLNHQLLNKTGSHENNTKENFRKNRLHRLKSKHRNGTLFDKKFRQSNEYILPTVNSNTKDDVFNTQLKNETSPETSMRLINISNQDISNDTNQTYRKDESLISPVTTVTTSESLFDQNLIDEKTTQPSVTGVFGDVTATEFSQFTDAYTTKSTKVNENLTQVTSDWKTTPIDFFSNLHYYSSAADKVISAHKSSTIEPMTTVSYLTSTYSPSTRPMTTVGTLGPTRFDASEYEQRNPNKGSSNKNSIFGKPPDVFQKRLHPLFIENEDQHVCYCEENRWVVFFHINVKLFLILLYLLICYKKLQ